MSRATIEVAKRPNPNRDLIQIRADPDWIERVNTEAERLGLSLSAYIRLAVNERLEQAPVAPPTKKRRKPTENAGE